MVKRLLILNGIAIIGAVLYHTTGWGFTALFWWTDRYLPVQVPNFDQIGGTLYYILRLLEQLVISSIPAFLFVSGYFIAVAAGRSQKTVSWKMIRTRVINLAIPFILWSALILFARMVEGDSFTPLSFLSTIVLGRTEAPFYFVPVLIQLYLISPFLVPLARKNWKLLLISAFILQSLVVLMRYAIILSIDLPWLEPFLFLTRSFLIFGNIFWFTFGVVFGLHLDIFKPVLIRYRRLILALVLSLFVLGVIEWELLFQASGQEWIGARETFVDNLYSLAILGAFFGYEHIKIPFSNYLSQLGVQSYGIYLTHSTVLSYSARLIYHFLPALLGIQVILLPVLFALGLGVPLVMMALVNRSPARKFYSYVFG